MSILRDAGRKVPGLILRNEGGKLLGNPCRVQAGSYTLGPILRGARRKVLQDLYSGVQTWSCSIGPILGGADRMYSVGPILRGASIGRNRRTIFRGVSREAIGKGMQAGVHPGTIYLRVQEGRQ